MLPGGNPRHHLGVPYAFDAKDHYRNTTKWVDSVNLPERIPEMLRRAFSALRNGRRGPVMVEVPMDVAGADLDEASLDAYRSPKSHPSMASPDDVVEIWRGMECIYRDQPASFSWRYAS